MYEMNDSKMIPVMLEIRRIGTRHVDAFLSEYTVHGLGGQVWDIKALDVLHQ